MGAFSEVKLGWAGRDYVIPPDRVLGAIARIEDVMTLDELSRYMTKRTAPLGKLAMAFGCVLRYAGAKVTDEEVYFGLFKEDQASRAMDAVSALLATMLPPDLVATEGDRPAVPTPATD